MGHQIPMQKGFFQQKYKRLKTGGNGLKNDFIPRLRNKGRGVGIPPFLTPKP